jgi:hypothetical protein
VHVWEHNNLAQKNLAVVDLVPDAWIIVPVVLNRFASRLPRRRLELLPSPAAKRVRAAILVGANTVTRPQVVAGRADRDGGLDCAGGAVDANEVAASHAAEFALRFEDARVLPLAPGHITELAVPASGQVVVGLRIQAPAKARPGQAFPLDIVERDETGRVVGGVAIQIRIQKGA